VTILTARWQADWPAEIEHRKARVVRLPQPARRRFGTLRYMFALERWLRRHRDQFDLVYVSMLKHDAYAALGVARRRRLPVVLRAEGAGLIGDVHWQLEAPLGRRIKRRCMRADGLVAPSAAIQAELVAAGYHRDRIHLIPNGVPIPPPRDADVKQRARRALAQINPSLALSPDVRLVVYTGRLHESKGLADLVNAWRVIVSRDSQARLWLVGEGPQRDALAEQISQLNLTGKVVLAGAFDSVDEVLSAADLFVLPSQEEGMSIALLEAMAAALPVVASDIAGNRQLIDDGVHGLMVPPGDANALAGAIQRLFEEPQIAERLGGNARARADREFSLERMAQSHLTLFRRLLEAVCVRGQS
jgi:glycosyltransferase involved in cell wall biosynthesis